MAKGGNPLMPLIDDQTQRVGSDNMALLLFTLGSPEIFGINVFKVREVCDAMPITKTPNTPREIEGVIALRGSVLPVFDLATCLNLPIPETRHRLIISECSRHTQGFLVHDVGRIVEVTWDHVHAPQNMPTNVAGKVTALTQLPDGQLVSILDIEQILSDVMGEEAMPAMDPIEAEKMTSVFFADDSPLARKKIVAVLDKMKLPHQSATNGRDAWDTLKIIAGRSETNSESLVQNLGLILIDAEMPEMNGYALTQHIKSDPRFNGIPVVMHSSLPPLANKTLGQQAGVDAYLSKFDPEALSLLIRNLVHSAKGVA